MNYKTKILIPKKIDLALLEREYYPLEVTGYKRDKAYFILHLIVTRQSKKSIEQNGYVHLNSKLIEKWVKNCSEYFKYLERLCVIEINHHYQKGLQSKSYRISPQYQSKAIKYIITDFTLLRSWNRAYYQPTVKSKNISNRSMTIASDFLQPTISNLEIFSWEDEKINVQWESEYTYTIASDALALIDKKYSSANTKAVNKYNYRFNILEYFDELPFNYGKISRKCGRLFYGISRIPKDLRPFVRVDGQPLVELDLKSSQLFFSLLLFEDWFYKDDHKRLTLKKLLENYQNLLFSSSPLLLLLSSPPSIMFEEIAVLLDGIDIEMYRFLVLEGKFYDWFSNRIRQELNEEIIGRPLKDVLFMSFFSKNRFFNQTKAKYKRLFTKYFPSVAKVFSLFQSVDHHTLPHLLELIEAHFFVFRFQFGIPNYPIAELHDAIITQSSCFDAVRISAEGIIKAETGLIPRFDIKSR